MSGTPLRHGLRGIVLAWALLLVVLGEILATSAFHVGRLGPVIVFLPAIAMVTVVGFVFMRLGRTVPLGQVFTVAALVWLVILMTLGTLDTMTRVDVHVSVTRVP